MDSILENQKDLTSVEDYAEGKKLHTLVGQLMYIYIYVHREGREREIEQLVQCIFIDVQWRIVKAFSIYIESI